jgi:uncharacterized repeat protein (TIGR02543 family)
MATCSGDQALEIVCLTRDGYKFTGWKDQDGKVWSPLSQITVGGNKDYTLEAQWEVVAGSTVAQGTIPPPVTVTPPPVTITNIIKPPLSTESIVVVDVAVPTHDNPSTGDPSNIGLWLATGLIGLAGAATVLARSSKRSKAL